ncbi:hypothetical protein ACXWQW_09500, partial [Streptococcus pyogenes]
KADLDAKVAAAQTAVGTAKADALAAVDDAVAKLNTAIEDFNAADFYTKAEADALLLQKVDRSSYDGLYTTSKAAITPMSGFVEYNT